LLDVKDPTLSNSGMSKSTCTEGQLSPMNNSPGPHFTANFCLRETFCLLGCWKIEFTKNISTKILISISSKS
jgi:uncharacterized protein involved in high-affinity Fe2+ transport